MGEVKLLPEPGSEIPLGEDGKRRFLSVAAILNYVCQDRPDVAFAVKESMRRSSAPTEADESRLKRICRYLAGVLRAASVFEWQTVQPFVETLVDSDFAGCLETRKSTIGGVVRVGKHIIRAYSKTLPVISLSSGEAELGAIVRGSAETLGICAYARDLGLSFAARVKSDALAAIGMVGREGLGKVRHLAVSDLWVQQMSRLKKIHYAKVEGCDNFSDALTKPLEGPELWRQMNAAGLKVLSGRSQLAPASKRASSWAKELQQQAADDQNGKSAGRTEEGEENGA